MLGICPRGNHIYDVIPSVSIKLLSCPCMNIWCISLNMWFSCGTIYSCCSYYMSLVVELVLDTRLRLMWKLADDSIPLIMGMEMPFRLTRIQLKSLASRIDPYWDTTSKSSFLCLNQCNPYTWGCCTIAVVDHRLRFSQTLFHHRAVIKPEFGSNENRSTWCG